MKRDQEMLSMAKKSVSLTAIVLLSSLILGGAWLLSSPTLRATAQAQEAVKPSAKWEYCMLVCDHKGRYAFNTAKDAIGPDSLKDLAKKLKVPLKDGEDNDRCMRMAIFDFLGAQGWELAGHSTVVVNETYVETFDFKRRVEK